MKLRRVRIGENQNDLSSLMKLLEDNVMRNGIIDITNLDNSMATELIDKSEIPWTFVSSNADQIKYIKDETPFSITALINHDNFKDMILIPQQTSIIEFNTLTEEELRIVADIKTISVERYYSDNPLINVFVNLTVENGFTIEGRSEHFVKECENTYKNAMVGAVKCRNCEAFGICDMIPGEYHTSEDKKEVSVFFSDDLRCYGLQNLVNFGDNKVLSSGQLKVILSALDTPLSSLREQLGQNSLFTLELSKQLENICKILSESGDKNEQR